MSVIFTLSSLFFSTGQHSDPNLVQENGMQFFPRLENFRKCSESHPLLLMHIDQEQKLNLSVASHYVAIYRNYLAQYSKVVYDGKKPL